MSDRPKYQGDEEGEKFMTGVLVGLLISGIFWVLAVYTAWTVWFS